MDEVRKHELELTNYALQKLLKMKGIHIIGPRKAGRRGGLIAFTVDGIHAHDVAQMLDQEGIAVRSGHHCTMPLHKRLGIMATTRMSFNIYNTRGEIDYFIEALKKVQEIFK
jgi:cysteine desulfurase/selenocysteine lyase